MNRVTTAPLHTVSYKHSWKCFLSQKSHCYSSAGLWHVKSQWFFWLGPTVRSGPGSVPSQWEQKSAFCRNAPLWLELGAHPAPGPANGRATGFSAPSPQHVPGCYSNAEQEMAISLFLYQSPDMPARLVSHSAYTTLSIINQDGAVKDSRNHRNNKREEKYEEATWQRSYMCEGPMKHVCRVQLPQNSDFLGDSCLLLKFIWLSGIISRQMVSKFASSWHEVISRSVFMLPTLSYPFSVDDKSFQQWDTNRCRLTIAKRSQYVQNLVSLSDALAMPRISSICLREKELEWLSSSPIPKETRVFRLGP